MAGLPPVAIGADLGGGSGWKEEHSSTPFSRQRRNETTQAVAPTLRRMSEVLYTTVGTGTKVGPQVIRSFPHKSPLVLFL